jgi:teichoic acid transport system ATP-binding protein
VRLAFAIAVHVEPEILIVDEALAVGDIHFQARCFDRFHQFQEQGVTVIFVTHDLNMVTRYCDYAYLLSHGELVTGGKPREVVAAYRKLETGHDLEPEDAGTEDNAAHVFDLNPYEVRYGNNKATITGGGIFDQDQAAVQVLHSGEHYRIALIVRFEQAITDPVFAYTIKDVRGTDIAGTNTHFSDIQTGEFRAGESVRIEFSQAVSLNAGDYLLSFGCVSLASGELEIYDRRHDYISFQVVSQRASVGIVDLGSVITIHREEAD